MKSSTNVLYLLTNLIVILSLVNQRGDTLTTSSAPPTDGADKSDTGIGSDSKEARSIWAIHWSLFMGVLIFIAVAIVSTLVCCVCLKMFHKKKSGFPQPETIVTEEPARLTSYAPVNQPMSEEGNGFGGPLPADEENGWIIPLDQMTPEELDQTEVALSKV